MRLLLASNNPKKRAELEAILAAGAAPASVEVVTPRELGGLPDVEEDQETFEANAAKKALAGARASGLWTLADDSGLEVEALDGAPGVRSARFAGEAADDARNNELLLEELAGVPEVRRGARFVCALALAAPDRGVVATFRGEVRGRILEEPRGEGGFGYDPLFLVTEAGAPGTGRSFAELPPEEKAGTSHRGRALAQLAERWPDLL